MERFEAHKAHTNSKKAVTRCMTAATPANRLSPPRHARLGSLEAVTSAIQSSSFWNQSTNGVVPVSESPAPPLHSTSLKSTIFRKASPPLRRPSPYHSSTATAHRHSREASRSSSPTRLESQVSLVKKHGGDDEEEKEAFKARETKARAEDAELHLLRQMVPTLMAQAKNSARLETDEGQLRSEVVRWKETAEKAVGEVESLKKKEDEDAGEGRKKEATFEKKNMEAEKVIRELRKEVLKLTTEVKEEKKRRRRQSKDIVEQSSKEGIEKLKNDLELADTKDQLHEDALKIESLEDSI